MFLVTRVGYKLELNYSAGSSRRSRSPRNNLLEFALLTSQYLVQFSSCFCAPEEKRMTRAILGALVFQYWFVCTRVLFGFANNVRVDKKYLSVVFTPKA